MRSKWAARKLRRVSAVFFNLTGAAHQRSAGEDRARHGAGSRQALESPSITNEALFRRVDALKKQRGDARPLRRAERACWSATTSGVRPPGRGARPRRQEAAGGDHRAARVARHAVRPERARRRDVPTRCVLEGEADLAGLSRWRRSNRRRRRPPSAACAGKHVITLVALLDRAVPAVLEPAATCARRPSRPGSRAARTAARPTTARSSPRWCALRAERAQAARLRELRGLPPRRHDGEDARGGARACSIPSGRRRARRRSAKPRRCRRSIARGRRQFRARAVGLALLLREAAEGRVRFRRRRDQALPRSSTT